MNLWENIDIKKPLFHNKHATHDQAELENNPLFSR